MYQICLYFLMFYCYSIMGWMVECCACSLEQKKFVHDRGFLIGPYCPIYGFGAMYMYLFLSQFSHEPIILFIMALLGTSLIEYLTSFFMEKIFKARWWDYSKTKFNIAGRICLRNSILFGILGIVFIYFINPAFLSVIEKIPELVLIIVSLILFTIFLVDNVLTFAIMSSLKKKLTNMKKDSTTDIDKQVKEILSKNTFYLKKLFRAFPKVRLTLPSGEKIVVSIQKTLDNIEKLRRDRKKRIKQLKKEMKLLKKEARRKK